MSCSSTSAGPAGPAISWRTFTNTSVPLRPSLAATSAIVDVRVMASPIRSGRRNCIRLPAHIRRGSGTGGRKPPRLRMAVRPDLRHRAHRRKYCQCQGGGSASPGSNVRDKVERRGESSRRRRRDDVGCDLRPADPAAKLVEREGRRDHRAGADRRSVPRGGTVNAGCYYRDDGLRRPRAAAADPASTARRWAHGRRRRDRDTLPTHREVETPTSAVREFLRPDARHCGR